MNSLNNVYVNIRQLLSVIGNWFRFSESLEFVNGKSIQSLYFVLLERAASVLRLVFIFEINMADECTHQEDMKVGNFKCQF